MTTSMQQAVALVAAIRQHDIGVVKMAMLDCLRDDPGVVSAEFAVRLPEGSRSPVRRRRSRSTTPKGALAGLKPDERLAILHVGVPRGTGMPERTFAVPGRALNATYNLTIAGPINGVADLQSAIRTELEHHDRDVVEMFRSGVW